MFYSLLKFFNALTTRFVVMFRENEYPIIFLEYKSITDAR